MRRTEQTSGAFFQGYPIVAVTLARAVSFVRTLMPSAAGVSGMGWLRFTLFDLAGVGLWLLLYVLVGTVAGLSWEAVTQLVGAGGLVLFLLVLLTLVLVERLASRRRRRAATLEGTQPASLAGRDENPSP